MRKDLYNILLCGSLLTLTGCSSEFTNTDEFYNEQHPIELSIGGEALSSRAVVTDGTGKTLTALPANTCISMVMKSEYSSLSDASLDYSGVNKGKTLYTATQAKALATSSTENPVEFEYSNIRYWDDIHARSSKLSIWAVTVPGVKSDQWGKTQTGWTETVIGTDLSWTIPANQTADIVKEKDLCFSNNIADHTPAPGTDSRLKFNIDPKGFDQGKLVFYHALSKITVNLIEDEGFDHDETLSDFKLLNNAVTLKSNMLSGTFNVANGEFNSYTASKSDVTMACGAQTKEGYTLEALVMPKVELPEEVSFSIDGNHFTVSKATLISKLKENHAVADAWGGIMEAGKNYVFTFNIKMTDIKVTATVAEWETLEGTNYSPLINVEQSYGAEGNDFGKGFSLYLSQGTNDEASLTDDFAKGTDVTFADSKYTLNTPLYWPNHQKHYLFRGVWPLVGTTGTPITPTDKVGTKSIAVQNVPYEVGTYPSDLMLGYPRVDPENCPHDKNSAEKGICATQGNIRMNFEYMMSQVEVNLSTSETNNSVKIDANTTVEIIGGYKEGFILFSNGSSDFTGKTTADYAMSKADDTNKKYLDAIIPQPLEGLKFRITVTDTDGKQDKYETVLGIKDIEVGIDGGTKSKISAWQPGKKYIYNLYITKTGIKVTATLKDWETVTSDSNHIWM